jgi:hypothetical protein
VFLGTYSCFFTDAANFFYYFPTPLHLACSGDVPAERNSNFAGEGVVWVSSG